MDSSHNNCFVAADEREVVCMGPDQATCAFTWLTAELEKERHNTKGQLSKDKDRKTCWDACESAVLVVGWRRSVGRLLARRHGYLQVAHTKTHVAIASADSRAGSVFPQDPLPFLPRCFPSVTDF